MTSIKTQESLLQKWFPGRTTPFIANAPMFGFADVSLATAVTNAGGLGFIGGGFDFGSESIQLQNLDAQLGEARDLLRITDSKELLPLGVGFITFNPSGFNENSITILQRHRVAAIWLSFPQSDSCHLPIIQAIRQAQETYAWNVRVFVQVGTVQAAKEAIQQGVDALVIQGTDAGGHQWAQGASLMSLLPEVRDLLAKTDNAPRTAILAAGGIVDGRGCLAALGLGADGIVMGTRFIATSECPAPSAIKRTIISTYDGAISTVKSFKHDIFQSTDLFPRQYDGRAVIGLNYNDFQNGLSDKEIIERYNKARENGEDQRRIVWAGASIGIINKVISAGDVVGSIQHEVRTTIERVMIAL